MDFALPRDLVAYLAELEAFIEAEIRPLEQRDDNIRFFDHRREWARTDFDNGGLPRKEWEALLGEAQKLADKAGHWRFSAPKKYGGKDGSNLWMAVIRDHFAADGAGAAQRPAERAFDRRQLPLRQHVRTFRHRGAAARIHHRRVRAQPPRRLRPDRAAPRL
jgi:alkylation response protein AidB-like acyl-CoA dehydrogenase